MTVPFATLPGEAPATAAADSCYSDRLPTALAYAAARHARQRRKDGIGVPYIVHPLAVASLVWAYGGDEDCAIAAVLHDVVEDTGGTPVLDDVRSRFGDRVARIVDDATDSTSPDPDVKLPWQVRKDAHIAHAATLPADSALVIACDKLHNLRDLVTAYLRDGEACFTKFKGGPAGTRWYYQAMRDALADRLPTALLTDLDTALNALGATPVTTIP
jgi:(p)ppGpp synthase/HD superfamily hydrolase